MDRDEGRVWTEMKDGCEQRGRARADRQEGRVQTDRKGGCGQTGRVGVDRDEGWVWTDRKGRCGQTGRVGVNRWCEQTGRADVDRQEGWEWTDRKGRCGQTGRAGVDWLQSGWFTHTQVVLLLPSSSNDSFQASKTLSQWELWARSLVFKEWMAAKCAAVPHLKWCHIYIM